MQTEPETTTTVIVPMTLDGLILHIRRIADDFIEAAQLARAAFVGRLEMLENDPAFQALEAREKPVVDAILKAEWAAIAEAMDQ